MLEIYKTLFSKYQLDLTDEQYDLLSAYATLLHEESEVQNVTAVREISDMWVRHFLDAAYVLRYFPADARSVIDVGTGGGIPGIPLAILCPNLEITLLDSELRKIEFCQGAISKLELKDRVQAICGRAEEFGSDSQYRGRFDLAVSRAMANGSMLTELSVPFLRVGGSLLAMKGRNYDPQSERFAPAAEALCAEMKPPIDYTLEGEQKYLIQVLKTHETPAQYPRRFAKIKRSPL